ncbi:hypothetical protein PC39_07824 [Salinisphaera sp. PC39]|uniref:sce7725 family protein n=1 Tax=Salinisphaera sp. PC39 TaxID=1304156 RepID=UPI00333F4A86
MYHPYFRGKQFELIAIRETAEILSRSSFVPIIEPVRESLRGLHRTLSAISDAEGKAIVIVNPHHGEHSDDGTDITALLKGEFDSNDSIAAGILLTEDMTAEEAVRYYEEHADHQPVFVHAGFTQAKSLVGKLGHKIDQTENVFFEQHGLLYRKHFADATRILLKDGFERRRNADYPSVEVFSDLHVTFKEIGMDGFGDFLIVGDDYSEGGGPAYAVAIHLTFIDADRDDEMYIYHFVSKTKDTPTDPAGKFKEALDELIETIDSDESHVLETSAIKEFRQLHANGHFPGLGYVKKLSMKHHIETLADYLN